MLLIIVGLVEDILGKKHGSKRTQKGSLRLDSHFVL